MEEHSISVYKSVNYISVLVGIIVMGAFIYDQHSVTVSVLAGVGFYGAVAGALIVTPHAKEIAIAHMKEVTIRRHDELPYEAQEKQQQVRMVDAPRLPDAQGLQPVRIPDTPSYVPAVPRITDTVRVDAANFVNQLFGSEDGRPLPHKITPSKHQIQHKSPTSGAFEYLASLGMVHSPTGKQLYFNIAHYPTLREAINAIRTGVSKGYLEEGKEEEEGGYE